MEDRRATIEVCFNCCVPLDDLQSNEKLDDQIPSQQFTTSSPEKRSKVNQIIITNSFQSENSTTTTINVSRVLSSIFKLKYLNAFSHEEEEDEEELSLCHDCSEVLTQLYSLFNGFIQLQKLNSSLAHRIERLDEIIDCHQQQSINCDLITGSRIYSDSCDNSTKKNSKLTQTELPKKGTNNVIFNREPRIVLTRLPPFSPSSSQQIEGVKEEVPALDIDFDDSLWEPIAPFVDEDSDDDPVTTKTEEPDSPTKEEVSDKDAEWTQPSTRRGRPARKRKAQSNQRTSIEKTSKKSKQSKDNKRKVSSSSKIKLSTELHSSEQVEGTPHTFVDSDSDKSKADTGHDNVPKKMKRGPYKKKERPPKPKPEKMEKRPKLGPPIPRKKKKDYLEDPTFKTRNETSYKIRRTKVPNPCWYCRLHFDTPQLCLDHTRKEHSSKITSTSQICTRCSKICIHDKSFRLHMTRCELIPMGVVLPQPFKCPECHKTFATPFQLRVHSVTHSNERPFACDQCPYAGKTAYVLSTHKLNVHPPVGDEKRKCDECGSILKNERYLYWHKVQRHTSEGEERYRQQQDRSKAKQKEKRRQKAAETSTICATCDVDFFTSASLTFHRKACHPEEYRSRSVCPLCGNSFSRVSTLSTHMKEVHSDARSYLCQKCGRDFKTAHNLRKHDLHTHNEEGRLRYNADTRERNRRKKLLKARHLVTTNNKPPQQLDHGGQQEMMMVDQDSVSNEYF